MKNMAHANTGSTEIAGILRSARRLQEMDCKLDLRRRRESLDQFSRHKAKVSLGQHFGEQHRYF
jgi:hypothetical protein